jgi:hypothetical protein
MAQSILSNISQHRSQDRSHTWHPTPSPLDNVQHLQPLREYSNSPLTACPEKDILATAISGSEKLISYFSFHQVGVQRESLLIFSWAIQ